MTNFMHGRRLLWLAATIGVRCFRPAVWPRSGPSAEST